jgi:Skp family chaperone for outer membrane proteins
MSISSLIGTRIFSGIGALALTGSILGGTAVAASPAKDNPIREMHHQLRDDSKAERDEIKDLRKQLADEYAKESPDLAKMASLNDQIEAKKDALREMRFDALMAMHDELDAAQRERVAEHLAREHGPKAEHDGKPGHEGKGKGKGKD